MLWIVSSNDKVPNYNWKLLRAIKALEDLTRYFAKIQTKQIIAGYKKTIYLYVSNNDKVPNDNNDPPELLELLLSKHWRMSD